MILQRRSFLAQCLALAAAPAIVRADSLMRVIPVDTSIVRLDESIAFFAPGHLTGKIYGLTIWNRALSDEEVRRLFESSVSRLDAEERGASLPVNMQPLPAGGFTAHAMLDGKPAIKRVLPK